MSTDKKRTLGRGLSALFGDSDNKDFDEGDQKVKDVNVDLIVPGKGQPRTMFKAETLEALTDSIKKQGILQPLLLRKLDEERYEIIAGERRWRAAKSAGLEYVPAIELFCDSVEAIEIGLIENLQRDNLNPIEEAESFQRLIDEYSKTQDEIAKAISKSRSYVANTLRLNSLPDSVKHLVVSGKLSAGHARSIATSSDIEGLANRIVQENLTVRDSEHLARSEKSRNQRALNDYPKIDPDVELITRKIGERLGMRTKLQFTTSGGALTFYFQNYEQLDELIGYLASN